MTDPVRRTFLSAALLLALGSSPGAARAAPAAPATPAAPASAACAPAFDQTFANAFAYDLTDEVVLRFLSLLATAPLAAQRHILESAVATSRTPDTLAALGAVATLCPDAAASAATGRAIAFVAHRWDTHGVDDETDRAIVAELGAAIFALAEPGRLGSATAPGALQPFAVLLPAGESFAAPSPAPAPSRAAVPLHSVRDGGGSCDVPNVDARTLVIAQPTYPRAAIAMRVQGSVSLKIALSERGSVQSVDVFARKLPDGPGADDIVEAATIAAAATTYAPGIVACRPIASTYIFRANFTGK